MTTTNPRTAAQLAQEAAALKESLAGIEAQRVTAERQEAANRLAEEKRLKALAEAQADLQRELDAVYGVMMKSLPGFDKLATRIEAATARYSEAASKLGDRFPDQPFIRHPVAKLLPWLKSFAPVRSGG